MNAVGIAAMVKSDRLQMEMIAQVLTEKLRVPVYVGGVEADMGYQGRIDNSWYKRSISYR